MALRNNIVMRNACVHSAYLLMRARHSLMALLCSLLCSTLIFSSAKATVVDAGFVVVYDNFSPQQVNQIMVFATRFKGYEQYEVLYQRSLDTQIHYQSEIDPKLLSFNFEQTFADLKWDVIAQQQGNQYQFTFVRVQPKPLPFGVW